jgi:hypothetical protein
MTPIEADSRSPKRKMRDEEIAAEPPLSPLDVASGAAPSPMESYLGRTARHPIALAGVVENGVVRLLDPGVKLPERSRVIVVAESA